MTSIEILKLAALGIQAVCLIVSAVYLVKCWRVSKEIRKTADEIIAMNNRGAVDVSYDFAPPGSAEKLAEQVSRQMKVASRFGA